MCCDVRVPNGALSFSIRLDLQRRKMDSYASNDVALDVACRLYFSDAFGFLRRVMLILEIAAPKLAIV